MANEIVTTVDPAKKAKSCEGNAIEQRNTRVDPVNMAKGVKCERNAGNTYELKALKSEDNLNCLTDEARKNQR